MTEAQKTETETATVAAAVKSKKAKSPMWGKCWTASKGAFTVIAVGILAGVTTAVLSGKR